jgi:hypothetical protein
MYFCAVVCTCHRGKNCKPSSIYAWMPHHQRKALIYVYQWFCVVKDMCHGARPTCHFVTAREQWTSACFQQKIIHSADAEGRVFFCFSDGPLVPLSSVYARECWNLREMPAATPVIERGELHAWFEGLKLLYWVKHPKLHAWFEGLKLLYWVKHCTVWNSKICVPSVTRQTRQ